MKDVDPDGMFPDEAERTEDVKGVHPRKFRLFAVAIEVLSACDTHEEDTSEGEDSPPVDPTAVFSDGLQEEGPRICLISFDGKQGSIHEGRSPGSELLEGERVEACTGANGDKEDAACHKEAEPYRCLVVEEEIDDGI